MSGGFLENISNTLSGWGTTLTQGANDLWKKTKDTTRRDEK